MTTPPLYRLTDVAQRYGRREALSVPSLELAEGETLALIGPSGAGKSTLLRLLALVEQPAAGALSYDGRPPAATLPLAKRREVTMMFQRPLLLDTTVEHNIAWGLKARGEPDDRVHPAIDAALDAVGLRPFARARARTLSGGEQQRVALARALVLRPRVLLLDEPTAHLDPGNIAIIEETLAELRASHATTLVVATHNLRQAHRLSDRALMLLDGQIIESGSTTCLLTAASDERTRAFVNGGMIV